MAKRPTLRGAGTGAAVVAAAAAVVAGAGSTCLRIPLAGLSFAEEVHGVVGGLNSTREMETGPAGAAFAEARAAAACRKES